jgi:UDP-N-acetylglucosamine 2-epimerase (non-hydrolysing)
MKVLFVFGTRPEAIKLTPVVRELTAQSEFDCKICVTGQHREMLAQVVELFDLRPDWNLELMRPDQDLAYLTGAALSGVNRVLDDFRPDRVIVQGDTTTTFTGRWRPSITGSRWRMSKPVCAPTISIRRGPKK